MLEDLDNEFDLKIRSMMENGREEVPDRVWDAVSDRLSSVNAGRVGKKRLIWLRNAGIGIVSAAAAVTAVMLSIPVREMPDGNAIAVVTEAPAPDSGTNVPGTVPVREDMEETSRRTASSLIAAAGEGRTARNAVPETASAIPQSVSDTPAESSDEAVTQTEDGTTEESSAGAEDSSEKAAARGTEDSAAAKTGNGPGRYATRAYNLPDPAADFPDGDTGGKKKPEVALAVFGNAISNKTAGGNGGAIPPMQSQGQKIRNEVAENGTTSYGIPLSFGAGAKIGFTRRWSMSIGVNYTLLTRTIDGTYYDGEGTAYTDSDIRNSQHYIGIPVNFCFSIYKGSFMDFYAYAGGAVEKCVADKYLIDATDRVISHNEKSAGVQLSANAGIGVEFLVGNRLGIYIDPSVRYYFESRQPNSIRKAQPLMLGFEAGLRVRL